MNRRRYIEVVLSRELAKVREAVAGGRNDALFAASAGFGGLVGAGALAESLAMEELEAAARNCGLPRSEAIRTIRGGLRRGKAQPRDLSAVGGRGCLDGLRRVRQRVAEERPRPRPPAAEVTALWEGCRPVTRDAEVAGWLRSRALDPAVVADRDLARALPTGLPLPSWARCAGRSWSDGWRLIVRAWGPSGRLESLRARWVPDAEPPKGVKSAAAAAGPGSAVGLVLADGLGRLVLEQGRVPEVGLPNGLTVCIAEGEPDFLTWGTRFGDAAYDAPAVFGVWSGAWSPAVAARIPAGATVVVRTHQDEAGRKYRDRIVAGLAGRCSVHAWEGGA